jgi:hypothetical protein
MRFLKIVIPERMSNGIRVAVLVGVTHEIAWPPMYLCQRARRVMWWQIDSPRSKRVTNTAARPFDWCFSRNDINRLVAGSPPEPDELTA